MPILQPSTQRNARRRLSPQKHARICEAICRELALEYFCRSNSKREVWARMVIGLPPVPRQTVVRERWQ
jgi:hypothetical protein